MLKDAFTIVIRHLPLVVTQLTLHKPEKLDVDSWEKMFFYCKHDRKMVINSKHVGTEHNVEF